MKFKIKVRNTITGDTWWETYDKDLIDPLGWAEEIVERFNNTLRPLEQPRELVDIEIEKGKR